VNNPKIQALTSADTEGLIVGYNIEDAIKQFDAIKIETSDSADLGKASQELKDSKSKFDIILRDASKAEGEKTLGEVRGNTVLERYKKLFEDPKFAKILTPEDTTKKPPEFTDLTMAHIQALQDAGYDVKKLLLTGKDGKTLSSEMLTDGKEFIINLGKGSELDGTLNLSDITHSASILEVDGQKYTFKVGGEEKQGENGVIDSGYYNEKGERLGIQDGTLIKVISAETPVGEEKEKKVTQEIADIVKTK